MALTLKTPGVYVEEVSTLPPSVAQVATAIPAFIGYTKQAMKPDGTSLWKIPTRISSMLEYETYFGGPDNQSNIVVNVFNGNINTTLDPAARSKYLMYYSLQMYFANGGGPCYIVSAKTGYNTFSNVELKAALDELEKEDEPTLIVIPEAVNLSVSLCYQLYEDALKQCQKLQDRFTIIDAKMLDLADMDVQGDMTALRGTISVDTDYRRYGAAYYPYLNTTLSYNYLNQNVSVVTTGNTDFEGQVLSLQAAGIPYQSALNTYILTDLSTISDEIADAPDHAALVVAHDDLRSKIVEIISATQAVVNEAEDAVNIGRGVLSGAAAGTEYNTLLAATNVLDAAITAQLEQAILDLNANLNEIDALDPATMDANDLDIVLNSVNISVGTAGTNLAMQVANIVTGTGSSVEDVSAALAYYSTPVQTPQTLAAIETSDNALYNRITAAISQMPVVLPPSAGMAGIYARVDANDGVWKAPANTGVSYVLGPVGMITSEQQEGMNVDDQAGKSVNAIRTFTGRGTLVWGARTLDGNSNEWRYISVRRFFNFVEESVQQATESFVFEGNDANTWVKVRAMIENFLILQWKAGALAGAKPEQAFYVRVGLGQTMTADDVLNGRMIVEIGMAVVRPAEFIVLRFSHMMQQA